MQLLAHQKRLVCYLEFYPKQKVKDKRVISELFKLADSKIEQIKVLKNMINNSSNDDEKRLYKAFIHSNKVMVEDMMREAGFMLPQSSNTNKLLLSLKGKDEEIDKVINKLLDKLEVND